SFHDGKAAADLAVGVIDAVAYDTGDALARGGGAVHVAHENRLTQVHANLRVTANAEITVGAVTQLGNGSLHGIEHRAHLGIGVLRDGPLAVVIGMAGGARI